MRKRTKFAIPLVVAATALILINTEAKTANDAPRKMDAITDISISESEVPYQGSPHTIIKNRLGYAEILITSDREPSMEDIGNVRYEDSCAIIPLEESVGKGRQGASCYVIKVPLMHMVREVMIERG